MIADLDSISSFSDYYFSLHSINGSNSLASKNAIITEDERADMIRLEQQIREKEFRERMRLME